MTEEELTELRQLLRDQLCGREPRHFQVEMVRCQQERRDALCQAATGMGKTAVAAGPYALPENKGRVTLMISPLIGLQNEMVRICSVSYPYGLARITQKLGRHIQGRIWHPCRCCQ